MDAALAAVAQQCLAATHAGSLGFAAIVGMLIEAGFEGYAVDYRRGAQTFYLPDGQWLDFPLPDQAGLAAAAFDAAAVEAQIRWAQSGDPAYSYQAFSRHATAAGCAVISFPSLAAVWSITAARARCISSFFRNDFSLRRGRSIARGINA